MATITPPESLLRDDERGNRRTAVLRTEANTTRVRGKVWWREREGEDYGWDELVQVKVATSEWVVLIHLEDGKPVVIASGYTDEVAWKRAQPQLHDIGWEV